MTPSTSEPVRVFVNAVPLDLPAGATALDAVRKWNDAEADAVASGTRLITDSRGLPVPTDSAVFAGAIFRLVSNRTRPAGESSEPRDG
jgi:hypothetical protein